MNDSLLEQLLHEEEGPTLDVKEGQYAFAEADIADKAELLKDILAFANSWRRTSAYILRGVREVKGGRSIPTGVVTQLNDSALQQFVNSKTNRPITFSYHAYTYQGVSLGILEIPIQHRPFYLNDRFGPLKANTVYLRRGSATVEADPEEVAQIGALTRSDESGTPVLSAAFGDPHDHKVLGPRIDLQSTVLEPKFNPRALEPHNRGPLAQPYISRPNLTYYDDLVTYAYRSNLFSPFSLLVMNTSAVPARDVVARIVVPRLNGLTLTDTAPYLPNPFLPHFTNVADRITRHTRPEPDLSSFADHWQITISFGSVLPRDSVWTASPLYIGSTESIEVTLTAKLFAANLPEPALPQLELAIATTTRPMKYQDISTS